MIRALMLSGLVLLWGAALIRADVDEKQPYGRACVLVADGKKRTESILDGGVPAAAGNEMTVHFEANREADTLVAVFTMKDSAFAHGWCPVLSSISEWDEHRAPVPPEKWIFPKDDQAFEVFVVFFAKNAPAVDGIRPLLGKLQDKDAGVAAARQLHYTLQKWQQTETVMATAPEMAPAAVGGTLRTAGNDFPWRSFAKRANYSAHMPTVIVFGHVIGK